jgi:hypothetical protein
MVDISSLPCAPFFTHQGEGVLTETNKSPFSSSGLPVILCPSCYHIPREGGAQRCEKINLLLLCVAVKTSEIRAKSSVGRVPISSHQIADQAGQSTHHCPPNCRSGWAEYPSLPDLLTAFDRHKRLYP